MLRRSSRRSLTWPFDGSPVKQALAFSKAFSMHMWVCHCLFDDKEALNQLKESQFDIVIGDVFDGCDALIGSYLNTPFIAMTTAGRYPFFHESIYGIPSPSSYVPFGILPLSDKMSYYERVISFIEHHILIGIFSAINYRSINSVKDKHGIAPGKDIRTILAEAELWLSVTNYAFDFPCSHCSKLRTNRRHHQFSS